MQLIIFTFSGTHHMIDWLSMIDNVLILYTVKYLKIFLHSQLFLTNSSKLLFCPSLAQPQLQVDKSLNNVLLNSRL